MTMIRDEGARSREERRGKREEPKNRDSVTAREQADENFNVHAPRKRCIVCRVVPRFFRVLPRPVVSFGVPSCPSASLCTT
jgi:hypothetical protein